MRVKALKIIIFDGSFKTTTFIRRLVIGLIASGHQVTIIGFNDNNPNPITGVTYQALGSNRSKLNLIVTSLQLALRSKDVGFFGNTLKTIIQGKRQQLQQQNLDMVLQKIKPDVVHVQWPSLLPWLEPYLPNDHFKVLLSQRGYHTNVRPFVDTANFQYLQHWYPKLDGLHSVSKAISSVGKQIGRPHTGIDQVVYTGLPLDTLAYIPKKAKENQPLQLLSVGRPHWIKDYPTALNACTVLKKQGIDFQYTIIGAAGNEELLFLIHQLEIQDSVIITHKLPQNEIYKQMQTADILLLTSIEEGMPNVAVEAMALGLPVISTDCGGMQELITDGKEGWIVPPRNPQALADTITKFKCFSLEAVHSVTKAARKKVAQQHSETKMIQDMEALYDKTLHS